MTGWEVSRCAEDEPKIGASGRAVARCGFIFTSFGRCGEAISGQIMLGHRATHKRSGCVHARGVIQKQ